MQVGEVLVDGFDRVRDAVDAVLDDVPDARLVALPEPGANTLAWLVWHLTRVQDDHVADAFGVPQLWHADGWADRAGLDLPRGDTGYGHDAAQVARVRAPAALLAGYHRAVHDRTVTLVRDLGPADLDRVVDTRWDPPVTLGVRLVSVLADDLQHAGQAAYLRGLLERA